MSDAFAAARSVHPLRAGGDLGPRPRRGCESTERLVGLDTKGGFDAHRDDRLRARGKR